MSKNVPTLLGIIIILLVALLVIGVYNIMLYNKMSEGGQMAGTKMTETLVGAETPEAATAPEIGTSAVKPATKPTAKKVPIVRRKGHVGKRAATNK
jgi:hypothetical protein